MAVLDAAYLLHLIDTVFNTISENTDKFAPSGHIP